LTFHGDLLRKTPSLNLNPETSNLKLFFFHYYSWKFQVSGQKSKKSVLVLTFERFEDIDAWKTSQKPNIIFLLET
jgi:hypothetical protein